MSRQYSRLTTSIFDYSLSLRSCHHPSSNHSQSTSLESVVHYRSCLDYTKVIWPSNQSWPPVVGVVHLVASLSRPTSIALSLIVIRCGLPDPNSPTYQLPWSPRYPSLLDHKMSDPSIATYRVALLPITCRTQSSISASLSPLDRLIPLITRFGMPNPLPTSQKGERKETN